MKHGSLVLVRHGESRLNKLNCFSGWLDIPLSQFGVDEARALACYCKRFHYTVAFTSELERAHETLLILLSQQKKIGVFDHGKDKRYNHLEHLPKKLKENIINIYPTEALNERTYGNLQGLIKTVAEKQYGKEQVFKWRRGFDERPPNGESLKDVFDRVVPYFKKTIHSHVKNGESVLLVAHGNTLRALMKYFENIPDDKISLVDLPTARPIVYNFIDGKYCRSHGEFNFYRPLR